MPELPPERRAAMRRLVTDEMTIADKVRTLHAAGYAKADIARFIKRRYQQVYNVLEAPQRRGFSEGPASPGSAAGPGSAGGDAGSEESAPSNADGAQLAKWHWVEIRPGGRVALPQGVLDGLGCGPGDKIQIRIDGDGVVTVRNRAAALRALQEEVAQYVPEGVDLAAELIADRRAEAARERGDD